MTLQVAAATLIAGFIIGYLWQRSGACSITGYRDFMMFKDTHLIKTVLGMFIGSFGGFLIFARFSDGLADFPFFITKVELSSPYTIIFSLIGGFGFGFFSILAGGCPLKQHVGATQGRGTAIFYLIGFYTGLLYFETVIIEYVLRLFG